jgi:S1-C subfamily serine protease
MSLDSLILTIRKEKVILDADLAAIYGVPAKRLNEQVKRNADRFVYGDNTARKSFLGFLLLSLLLFAVSVPLLAGQRQPGPAQDPDDRTIASAREALSKGETVSGEVFAQMFKSPKLQPVALLPKAMTPLKGRELARLASGAYVRIGWVYQCTRCNHWHIDLAGGYAIGKDTVVTAYHVLTPPEHVKKGTGFPVVVRGDEEILGITGVLAADEPIDAAVLRVACSNLSPLPLADELEVGDPVYCLSDPDGNRGIFTAGIVNHREVATGKSREALAAGKLIVSTDWAPGSSGAAILDGCGNVVGHVSMIEAITYESEEVPSDTRKGRAQRSREEIAMSLHQAVPASSVCALLEPAGN